MLLVVVIGNSEPPGPMILGRGSIFILHLMMQIAIAVSATSTGRKKLGFPKALFLKSIIGHYQTTDNFTKLNQNCFFQTF